MSILSKSKIVVCAISLLPFTVQSEIDWIGVTLDNDLFVGSDNGYTNGLYVSAFDVGQLSSDDIPTSDIWILPLRWTLPDHGVVSAVNGYTFGQTMSTPSDITIAVPDETELPYSALLAFTNSYVIVTNDYADRVSTTLGIVGPSAFGAESQKTVHKIIGSDEPKGWDTQLKDELVFLLSRARVRRNWVSDSGQIDILTYSELSLGTIQSAVSFGVGIRHGTRLGDSYATTLFNSSRSSNPAAIDGAWYIYGGINTGYVFNQIFADGNTFRESRSIEYDHEFIGVSAGFAYSWDSAALSFAVNNANIIQSSRSEETLDNITVYGTITLAWQL